MSTMALEKKEREHLPAEGKFNKWVYGGISYAAQALSGSGLAYWIKHSGGRPYYDKMADWLGENFISKISKKRGAAAIASADYWITVTTMVAVGTLFVIPVKWLEDKKASIVEKWTKQDNDARTAAGNPLSAEELAHQEKLLEELKAEPKQTWWSMMIGRAASLVPVYTALPLLSDFNKTMEAGFQRGTKATANALGMKKLANSEALHNASGIAFYDGFYSMISAGGLFVFSKLVAPLFSKKEKEAPVAIVETQPQQVAKEKHHEHQHEHKVTRPEKRKDSFAENILAQKHAEPNYTMAV